jgi:hypothetical protein
VRYRNVVQYRNVGRVDDNGRVHKNSAREVAQNFYPSGELFHKNCACYVVQIFLSKWRTSRQVAKNSRLKKLFLVENLF